MVAVEAALEVGNSAPLIMCTGGFKSKKGIMHALQQDGLDLVGLGRAAAVDLNLPIELLLGKDTKGGKEQVKCVDYRVRGGEWLKKLVPLKLVGGSIVTLWHQLQMHRIARKKNVILDYSFEYLLMTEVWKNWGNIVVTISSIIFLAVLWIWWRL